MPTILFIVFYVIFFLMAMKHTWKITKQMPESNSEDAWLLMAGLAVLLILAGVAFYYLMLIGLGYKMRK